MDEEERTRRRVERQSDGADYCSVSGLENTATSERIEKRTTAGLDALRSERLSISRAEKIDDAALGCGLVKMTTTTPTMMPTTMPTMVPTMARRGGN